MNIVIVVCVFGGALLLLLKSADFFVEGAVGIAYIFKISKIVVGIVLVSLATTLPELSVSVQSAYLGHPEMALGNAVGSVMCDEGIALAMAAILSASIAVEKHTLKRFGFFLILSTFLTYGFAFDAFIERWEGVILVSLLAGYFYYLVRTEKSRNTQEAEILEEELADSIKDGSGPSLKRIIIFFILGAAGVILSSRAVIWAGLEMAEILGVPEIIIGLTMVAIGTSLPEITTAIVSALKGHGEVAVGNVLGADVLNILWIIGVAASVNPIRVNPRTIAFAYPWMLAVVVVMVILLRYRYELTRRKGFLLLGMYAVYLYQMAKWMAK